MPAAGRITRGTRRPAGCVDAAARHRAGAAGRQRVASHGAPAAAGSAPRGAAAAAAGWQGPGADGTSAGLLPDDGNSHAAPRLADAGRAHAVHAPPLPRAHLGQRVRNGNSDVCCLMSACSDGVACLAMGLACHCCGTPLPVPGTHIHALCLPPHRSDGWKLLFPTTTSDISQAQLFTGREAVSLSVFWSAAFSWPRLSCTRFGQCMGQSLSAAAVLQ